MDWDKYFMTMAYLVAMKSKDPRTRVGSVIVGPDNEIRSTGYNGLPRGMAESDERNLAPNKYLYYQHSETNALLNSARMGTPTKGCSIYTLGTPCADCARSIIQSGIMKVVTHSIWPDSAPRWAEQAKVSRAMFKETGVELLEYKGDVEVEIKGLSDGKPLMIGTSSGKKCEAILRKMIELANDGEPVTLEEDFGKFTATILVGGAHTHVGVPGEDGSWDLLVDNLYSALHGGPGLSWHEPNLNEKLDQKELEP